MTTQYRKKPVVIEAMQYTFATLTSTIDWLIHNDVDYTYQCDELGKCSGIPEGHALAIPTLEGSMTVSPGDYIIKGVQGEFYPCKPDIFDETYEPAVIVEPAIIELPDPEQHGIEVYRVGLLSDIKIGRVRLGVKHYLIPQIKAGNWRAVRSYFNGYLAEWHYCPEEVKHTKCGRGWTKRAALRRLGKHIVESNLIQKAVEQ